MNEGTKLKIHNPNKVNENQYIESGSFACKNNFTMSLHEHSEFFNTSFNDIKTVSFDTAITDEVSTAIAQKKSHYTLFCDKSFAKNDMGINFEQVFETYTKNTVRKVI